MPAKWVALAAACTVMALAAQTPGHAASDVIDSCLKSETAANRDVHGCIGRMAAACTAKPAGQSTVGESDCAQQEAQVWDKLLNSEYAALLGLLKPEAAEDLRKAQRVWVTSRDADCRIPYYFYEGGSIVQILGARCLLDRTAERALLIRSWREMAKGE